MSSKRVSLLLLLLLVATVGCAKLNDPSKPPIRRYSFAEKVSGKNTHSLFVCLTFSGGGTRAAALSYGVLDKLRNTEIVWKGETKNLLDEVDCISSVSGGSFSSAYYGLFGDRIFTEFRSVFLEKNVQLALFLRLMNPFNWFRLASPYFSRIDLAAEYYDKNIFDHQTFTALAESKRPFIIINATNLANGERFAFTQEQFDFLGSDLSSYPVARAVAASSAFPFLLSPLSLKNHPKAANYKLPMAYSAALEDYDDNRRRYYWARNRAMYVTDQEALPYIHLMDGGLADNIGIRPIEAAFRRGFIRRALRKNNDPIEKLVIIVVNARTQSEDKISERRKPPGFLFVAKTTATAAMDNYSVESIEVMRDLENARKQTQDTLAECRDKLNACGGESLRHLASGELVPYMIDVSFEALPDKERREYFLRLPTSFKLSDSQVEKLITVGPELLDRSRDFQVLLEDMAAR